MSAAGRPASVKVHVRLFALYRERAGVSQYDCEVGAGATLADLLADARARFPDIAPLDVGIVAAVNEEYADADVVLRDGDVVALIPPVSGGQTARDWSCV